jgi:hypothetical protein
MTNLKVMNKRILWLFSLVTFVVGYISFSSFSGGISSSSVSGCSCHGSISPATLINISGLPANYIAGSVYTITLTASNTSVVSAARKAGFNMAVNLGSFGNLPAGVQAFNTKEIGHNTPQGEVGGGFSWTFTWQAPASGNTTAVLFTVACNVVNGDGGTGGGNGTDKWNKTTQTVNIPVVLPNITATASSILCNGGTASITANASSGTSPYQYSLNNGAFQSSGMFSAVAGSYTITVKDNANATKTTLITITQPVSVNASATNTNLLCFGKTDATAVATATGGTGMLSYNWLPGNVASAQNLGIGAGVYTCTVKDINNCSTSSMITVTSPSPITISNTITQPLCFNSASGSIQSVASGGTGMSILTCAPSIYTISPGTFADATPGVYTITATDNFGCEQTATAAVVLPNQIIINNPVLQQPTCNGNSNGAISITASNGTGAKTFTIQPIRPQPVPGSFTNINSSIYVIKATDANGCTRSKAFGVPQPSQVNFTSFNLFHSSCFGGSNGSINFIYAITYRCNCKCSFKIKWRISRCIYCFLKRC